MKIQHIFDYQTDCQRHAFYEIYSHAYDLQALKFIQSLPFFGEAYISYIRQPQAISEFKNPFLLAKYMQQTVMPIYVENFT